MAEQAPEHQDRGLFGLFGKKKEEGKHDDDQILQPPATHIQNEAASYYPTPPQHGVEHGHGHEGQLTPEEAEKQKHTGLLGKLHRTHSSSSSSVSLSLLLIILLVSHCSVNLYAVSFLSFLIIYIMQSSDEEEEGRKKKEGGRKKKGAKDKNKEKFPGGGQHSSDQCAGEEEKKAGLLDKIKEKLPGHHNKKNKEGEEEEKK